MELTQQQIVNIGFGVATTLIILFLIQIVMYMRIKKRQKMIIERDIESNSLGLGDISSFKDKLKTIDTKLGYLDDSISTIMFQLDELSKTIDKEFNSVKQTVDFKKHLVEANNAKPISEVQEKNRILSPKDVLRDLTPKPDAASSDDLDLNKSTIYNIYGNKYDANEDTKTIDVKDVTEEDKIKAYFSNLDDMSEKIDKNLKSNMDQDELAKTMNVSKSELEFVRSFNQLRGGE
jgi:hypothetical protein